MRYLKRPKPIKKDAKGRNKLEAEYGAMLEMRKRAGEILDYLFEPVSLRLADKTFYRPDYMVVTPEHFEIHEVKGFWQDDARVKIKVAAEMYPWFKFVAIRKVKKQWEFEEF